MELAYAITARGGSVVSAGLPAQGANFSYMHAGLVSDEKSILGSYMGSCVPEQDIPRFLGLYKRGELPVERLKSGSLPLAEINAAFDRLANGIVLGNCCGRTVRWRHGLQLDLPILLTAGYAAYRSHKVPGCVA